MQKHTVTLKATTSRELAEEVKKFICSIFDEMLLPLGIVRVENNYKKGDLVYLSINENYGSSTYDVGIYYSYRTSSGNSATIYIVKNSFFREDRNNLEYTFDYYYDGKFFVQDMSSAKLTGATEGGTMNASYFSIVEVTKGNNILASEHAVNKFYTGDAKWYRESAMPIIRISNTTNMNENECIISPIYYDGVEIPNVVSVSTKRFGNSLAIKPYRTKINAAGVGEIMLSNVFPGYVGNAIGVKV